MSEPVMVCDACGTAACWNGDFYCENYRTAGIRPATIEELVERSSFGTPAATAARASVSDVTAAKVVGMADGMAAEQRRVLALLDDPDLLEDMARAEYDTADGDEAWEETPYHAREQWLREVRAALDVLRARIEGDDDA